MGRPKNQEQSHLTGVSLPGKLNEQLEKFCNEHTQVAKREVTKQEVLMTGLIALLDDAKDNPDKYRDLFLKASPKEKAVA